MPLLRGVARTAVVAGTATAVSNRVSRRQEGRWAQQEQQQWEDQQRQMSAQAPAQAVAAPPQEEDPMERLEKLGDLHNSGVLTDEEFATAKAKILNG
jgi:membrane protease subunit (stomatin/prohibitin family)